MIPGNTILARLQQSDGRLKTRPAIVLPMMPPYNDLLISGISSKLRHEARGFDELIRTTDADFAMSGLKVDSLIRLGLIATIPASAVIGELGSVSDESSDATASTFVRSLESVKPGEVEGGALTAPSHCPARKAEGATRNGSGGDS